MTEQRAIELCASDQGVFPIPSTRQVRWGPEPECSIRDSEVRQVVQFAGWLVLP